MRLLRLGALPLLAVSVSIGAVMPSAPFDAWSPPPVPVEHGTRPAKHPAPSAPGERGVPLRAPAGAGRDDRARSRRGRPAPATVPMRPGAVGRVGPGTEPPAPARPRADGTPLAHRWVLSRWAGTTSGPLRAPPRLPTA